MDGRTIGEIVGAVLAVPGSIKAGIGIQKRRIEVRVTTHLGHKFERPQYFDFRALATEGAKPNDIRVFRKEDHPFGSSAIASAQKAEDVPPGAKSEEALFVRVTNRSQEREITVTEAPSRRLSVPVPGGQIVGIMGQARRDPLPLQQSEGLLRERHDSSAPEEACDPVGSS